MRAASYVRAESGHGANYSRRMLLAVDEILPEHRAIALGLQFCMNAMRAQFAALHVRPPHGSEDQSLSLLVATPAPDGGALFEFLSAETKDSIGHLASKAVSQGHAIAVGGGRGPSHSFRLPCSALSVPLLEQEQTRAVGALTLVCSDPSRTWTADEQNLSLAAAPLFSLHLTRERMAAQAAVISGALTSDEQSRSKQMSDHAAKVVHEMRGVHAAALKKQRDDFRAELSALSSEHARRAEELEEQLQAAQAKVEATERESAVRMHKMMEGLELQHIAELDALREDFAARDPSAPPTQPRHGGGAHGGRRSRHSRPTSAPGTFGARSRDVSRDASRDASPTRDSPPSPRRPLSDLRNGALVLPAPIDHITNSRAGGGQLGGRPPAGDANGGKLVRSGRPVPASAVTVNGGAARLVKPQLDMPKNSKPLPPPPPPNWEATELSEGKVHCTPRISPSFLSPSLLLSPAFLPLPPAPCT